MAEHEKGKKFEVQHFGETLFVARTLRFKDETLKQVPPNDNLGCHILSHDNKTK